MSEHCGNETWNAGDCLQKDDTPQNLRLGNLAVIPEAHSIKAQSYNADCGLGKFITCSLWLDVRQLDVTGVPIS